MKIRKEEIIWLILFITPAIGLFLLFFIIPILFLFITSFTNWDGISADFIGIDNYVKLLNNKTFIRSIINNLYWCLTAAFITVPLALIIALLLAHRSRGWKVFRTILFIPQVVSSAAIALLWLALYNSEYGLVNYLLDYIGLSEYKNHNWLGSLRTAQPALIAFSLCYVGYFMVIMLAKTAGISDDYYDAATIDGASQFQKDLHITAPLIKSTFFLCIILAVIFNLRQFEFVYLMTNGGPANRTSVLVLYIWKELSIQRLGLGNAAGVIMISLGAILLIIMRKILKSETYN
ncbi:MAG TPA: sugar ABC transporter permease [Pelagibacterales bacterium]|jgi:raffinose/stachyose/melibiose transport system permease protein|nr:sugar ABC transporter permease [Pelagibacterales bacterium]